MPVITRSKLKEFQTTSFLISTSEFTKTVSSDCSSPILLNNHSKRFYESPLMTDAHRTTSSLPESENFQNSMDEFENSKLSTFENMKRVVEDTTDISQNFATSDSTTMEGDCNDSTPIKMQSKNDPVDITQLFTMLSQQITQLSSQNMTIQDQLCTNEENIPVKIQMVVQEDEDFKTDIHMEMEELQNMILKPNIQNVPAQPSTSNVVPDLTPSTSGNYPGLGTVSGLSHMPSVPSPLMGPQDAQNAMLLRLTESFSKLSSNLSEKS
jgi:hypothetical protein